MEQILSTRGVICGLTFTLRRTEIIIIFIILLEQQRIKLIKRI